MSDQAERLRQLVEVSRAAMGSPAPGTLVAKAVCHEDRSDFKRDARVGTKSLLFTSGKGGVGTSNIVLNLAIALTELGQEVLVIDADLGLANLDILCGLTPRNDLGDVLSGRCTLADAIMEGPGGLKIVPGAHAIRVRGDTLTGGAARLADELRELESGADFVLVDAGSGLRAGLKMLVAAADEVVVVTTPEPTSLADAHATIARFKRLAAAPRLRILVNQAGSAGEASEVVERLVASCRQFLGAVVTPLGSGSIRSDVHVPLSVRSRQPFIKAFPGAPAARGVRRMARALVQEDGRYRYARRSGFFASIAARWALAVRGESFRDKAGDAQYAR